VAILVLQSIEIRYRTEERGGAAATRRARLPRGVLLPAVPEDDSFRHVVRLDSWGDYVPRASCSRLRIVEDEITVDGVAITRTARGLLLPGDEVPIDRWVRMLTNGIEGGFEHRWYRESSHNLGLFREPPEINVFTGEPPAVRDRRSDFLRNGQVRR
jgi:hypothetical protein